MYKTLWSNELDVRNSPLDIFASYAAKIIWCAKGLCDVVVPAGLVYGTMRGIDELRVIKGHEAIFVPFIADLIISDTSQTKIYK